MNKKIIAFGLVASFAVLNAYATNIENGSLVSHKEWNTGQFTSSFLDVESDARQIVFLKQLATLSANTTYPEDIDITDNLSDTHLTGTTSTPTTIKGTSNFMISNMSSTSQTYTVTTKICVASDTFPIQCANAYDVIQLDAQGVASVSRLPKLVISLPNAGSYVTMIATDISRDDNALFSFHTTGALTIT